MQQNPISLTAGQRHGLEKLGDVYVPGDAEFPSFSRLGCAAHAEDILRELPERDRRSLKWLLGACRYAPRWLLALFIRFAESGARLPVPPGGTLRLLRLGLRSIIFTLYYSGRVGPTYEGPSPVDVIGYDVSVFTDDLETT